MKISNINIMSIMLLSFLSVGNCYAELDVTITGKTKVGNGSEQTYTVSYSRDPNVKGKTNDDKPTYDWSYQDFVNSEDVIRGEKTANGRKEMTYYIVEYINISKLPHTKCEITCTVKVKDKEDSGEGNITIGFYDKPAE